MQPLTTEQIADLIPNYADLAEMNADKRTNRAIPLKALELLQNRTGMLVALQEKLSDETVDPSDKVKIASYIAHVQSPRQTELPTNEADVAEQADAVLRVLAAPSELVAVFYALGGGLVIPEAVLQEEWDAGQVEIALRAAKRLAISAATQELENFKVRFNAYVASVENAEDVEAIPSIEEL